MRFLFSGFVPFGGERLNSSWEAVHLLPERFEGHEVRKVLLPVEFGAAGARLSEEICSAQPDVVICVGQAGNRAAITPEKVAINCRHAKIPDNAGFQPDDTPVCAGAPAAYFSTLPIAQAVKAMRSEGLPAEISYFAGTYVCNSLMYELLHRLAQAERPMRGGFVHLPYLPQQLSGKPDATPCLSAEDAARGLLLLLRACAQV